MLRRYKYALSQRRNVQFRIKHAPLRVEIIINNYQRLETDISTNAATSRAKNSLMRLTFNETLTQFAGNINNRAFIH